MLKFLVSAVGAVAAGLTCQAAENNGVIRVDFPESFLDQIQARVAAQRQTLDVPRRARAPEESSPGWEAAATIEGLLLADGTRAVPGASAQIMFDEENLYFSIACDVPRDRPLPPPTETPPERDASAVWGEDHLELWINPAPPAGREYQFVVGASGVIYDLGGGDAAYDPDWSQAITRDAKGWRVEIQIPKTSLGLDAWPAKLAFNIGRNGPYVRTGSWTGSYGDLSGGLLTLAGISERVSTPDSQSAAGSGLLQVSCDRAYARPGERWLELEIGVPTWRLGEKQYRLAASVFALNEDQPVARGGAELTRSKGRVAVDLRTLGLKAARLRLALFSGAEDKPALDAVEMFIAAQDPETPLMAGEKIAIGIDQPAGAKDFENYPVVFGVPFAAGTLWNPDALRLEDEAGNGVPCQFEAVGRWAREGAIKWVRCDALVSAGKQYFLVPGGASAPALPATPLRVKEEGETIIVETGAATYVLEKALSPVREIRLGGERLAWSAGTRGLYVVDQNDRLASAAADEATMTIEARGPVASCVRIEGYYRIAGGEALARHITRVENFAGEAQARITHSLVLCRSTTNCWFKEIGWELAAAPGADPAAWFGTALADPAATLEQPLDAKKTPGAYLLQAEHYLFARGTNRFELGVLDGHGRTKPIAAGEECGDWGALSGKNGAVMLVCRDLARQHPKEIEIHGDKIILKLFSNRAGEELDFRIATLADKWDLTDWYTNTLPHNCRHEAEAMATRVKATLKSDAIGWAKTHILFMVPLAPGATAAAAGESAHLLSREVQACAAPEWIYRSTVFGPLHPRDPARFPEAENLIAATFRLWEKRIGDWGDYGFIYYFTGPHLSYSGNFVAPYRYAGLFTYTLRSDLWRIYARSGDRRIRDLAEKTNRTFGDSVIAHWDGPGKVKGLLVTGASRDLQPWDLPGNLPLHWQGSSVMNVSSSTDLDNFLGLYYLTGCRRALDIIGEYAEGIKKFWTPERIKRDWRAIASLRLLVQAYSVTWDPALRDLAEATVDSFADDAGEIGLTKERPYRSTTYKTRVDIPGLFDAWEILGNARCRALIEKLSRHWWRVHLGDWPIFYVNHQGIIGNFLYELTGNRAYAEMLALQTRQAASSYNPVTDSVSASIGAEDSTFVFQGIPYAQDLVARTGADKALAASWVAYEDFGYPSSIVAYKADNGILNIEVKTSGKAEKLDKNGAVGGIGLRPAGIGTTSGLDLNRLVQYSGGAAQIRIPKDAPEGAYEILVPAGGFHIAAADARGPLVLYAPDYWRAAPRQSPPITWYFNVPTNVQDAQIFLETAANLCDPEGNPWPADAPAENWVDLPADKPGLWSFTAEGIPFIKVKNLPPFFAARDKKSYFEPPLPWQAQAKQRPIEKPDSGTLYVPGAIQTPDNQALYLDSRRTFTLQAGEPHASGDGSHCLPFAQGTIEFFFKPFWSTFDLPPQASRRLLQMNVKEGEPWALMYNKNIESANWMLSHVLFGYFMTDLDEGDSRRASMRAYRQALVSGDEWLHVAWVWGPVEQAGFVGRAAVQAMTTRIFVNGRRGRQNSYSGRRFAGRHAADCPRTLLLGNGIEAAYDELRVSDIQRYQDDFRPPPRDLELPLDQNTRALFHFNGNLEGAGHGWNQPAEVAVK